ncbi:family A G protein-coupled receptor-like protein [Neoconidiobolus thromboides FSU 785]|nr:family A G protein-coupled receptor-like protein [Neoconidiobolus thromboides FSU 785]
MDSNLPELYTWQALLVPTSFMLFNLIAMIPSLIILIVVIRTKSLQTTDNLMTLQMVFVDIVFAGWVLVWYTLKLASGYRLWDFYTCQMEGSMILICGFTWLMCGTFLGFYRFRKVIGSKSTHVTDRVMLIIQYGLWLPSIIFACVIGLSGDFRIMPSFAYCYIRYVPDAPQTHIHLWATLAILIIPVIASVYFYWAITAKYCTIVRQLIEAPVPTYLPSGHARKSNTEGSTAPLTTITVRPTPKSHLRKVAFKCVLYALVFILCFLPMTCTIIYELATSQVRSPTIDAICISLVMLHKIMSPMITLFINDTINHQIRVLLGYNPIR